MFVIQILREELEQYQKAYNELQALFKPGAKNLPLARSRVSWLYILILGIVVGQYQTRFISAYDLLWV